MEEYTYSQLVAEVERRKKTATHNAHSKLRKLLGNEAVFAMLSTSPAVRWSGLQLDRYDASTKRYTGGRFGLGVFYTIEATREEAERAVQKEHHPADVRFLEMMNKWDQIVMIREEYLAELK